MPRKSSKLTQRNVVPRDIHGWIDAEKYKPEKELYFDLLMLMDDQGKTQQGWWCGHEWDYHPKKIGNKIIKWRFLDCTERCMND